MRLSEIQDAKAALSKKVPIVADRDISDKLLDQFSLLLNEPFKRKLARRLAVPYLTTLQRRLRREMKVTLPFQADLLCREERFGSDASLATLLGLIRNEPLARVLVPGCYQGGEDVQFWLRRGADRVDGIDVYCLRQRWEIILSKLRSAYPSSIIEFQQAPIEAMPFGDVCFDLIATAAVLEHVQNLEAMTTETARVLRPGGWAWHSFGPLYWSFGGDHCIAAYGDDAGFDHLRLSEEEYQRKIYDQSFFDNHPDPNLPFWARQQQFSFATLAEYLVCFGRHFEIRHLVVKISAESLHYRVTYPERWQELLESGIHESDLLVKGASVILRKPLNAR